MTRKEKPRAKTAKKARPKVEVLSSKLSYEGPLFRVYTDEILENGRKVTPRCGAA